MSDVKAARWRPLTNHTKTVGDAIWYARKNLLDSRSCREESVKTLFSTLMYTLDDQHFFNVKFTTFYLVLLHRYLFSIFFYFVDANRTRGTIVNSLST